MRSTSGNKGRPEKRDNPTASQDISPFHGNRNFNKFSRNPPLTADRVKLI